jgi:hypothetical protein
MHSKTELELATACRIPIAYVKRKIDRRLVGTPVNMFARFLLLVPIIVV